MAVLVEVARVDAHAASEHEHAGVLRDVRERAVAVVAIERADALVVALDEVLVAVVVVVEPDGLERHAALDELAAGPPVSHGAVLAADARLLCHVREGAVAVVAVEDVGVAHARVLLAVDAKVGHVQVQEAVHVVVDPGCAGAVGHVVHAGQGSDVRERAVGVVAKEQVGLAGLVIDGDALVLAVADDVEVLVAVVVVVGPSDTVGVARGGDARLRRHVREGAVAVAAVQHVGAVGGDVQVRVAVVVVVAPRGAWPEAVSEVLRTAPGHAGQFGDLGEPRHGLHHKGVGRALAAAGADGQAHLVLAGHVRSEASGRKVKAGELRHAVLGRTRDLPRVGERAAVRVQA